MAKTRNILASFKLIDDAKKAGKELKEKGINEIQIDQIGAYPGYNMNNLMNPLTGGFGSLADLTLGSFSNKSAEILASSDVAASGMADGSHMEINQNILLTVVTTEELADIAEEIITKHKGEF